MQIKVSEEGLIGLVADCPRAGGRPAFRPPNRSEHVASAPALADPVALVDADRSVLGSDYQFKGRRRAGRGGAAGRRTDA